MFVLDIDDRLPADDAGSPWVFSRLNTEVAGRLGFRGAVSTSVRYTTSEVGRLPLGGAQDAPLRYTVDLAGRMALHAAVSNAVHSAVSMLPTSFGFRSNSAEAGHYTVVLVGRDGFTGANFGGSSAQQIFPVWLMSPDQMPMSDFGADSIIELEVPLVIEDVDSGRFGVVVSGRLGVRGVASMSVRYGLTETARFGAKGADQSNYHPALTQSGRLSLQGSTASIVPGTQSARFAARGAGTVLVRYATSMASRFGVLGATTDEFHPATSLASRFGAESATEEALHNTVNEAGRIAWRGSLGILIPTSYIGRFGLGGSISMSSRRTIQLATRWGDIGITQDAFSPDVTMQGRFGFVGTTEEGQHFTVDQAGRLYFNGAVVVVLPGSYVAHLAMRGAVTVGVTYLTDLQGVIALTGATENALHNTIELQARLGLLGSTTDDVAFTTDLAGRINLRGSLTIGRGFVVLGRILTSDGTPMYLVRKERRH